MNGMAEQNIEFTAFGADACIAKGPFKELGRHITTLIEQVGQGRTGDLSEKIIGLKDIYTREVTSELLSSKKHF